MLRKIYKPFAIGTMIFMVLMKFSAMAQNSMSIPNVSTGAASQAIVAVNITNANAFTGFQLDIPLPVGISYVANTAAINPSRSNGHILSAAIVGGSTLRIIAFSFSNAQFNGSSGAVASFSLLTSAVPGDYPLQILNAVISGTNATNILTATVDGTLTVLAPDIQITPLSQDFGEVPLGQTSDRTFEIQNTGNQTLQISSVGFSNPGFTILSAAGFAVEPGNTANVQVRFTASVKGHYNERMTIVTNDPDEVNSQVVLTANAFAVNELHCGNLLGASGTTVELAVSINNMESFTGFQFDLQLPAPLTYVSGSSSLDPARAGNHLITVSTINEQTLRVIAFSATNATFNGNNGAIAYLDFQINGTGGGYPLNISQIIIGDGNGTNILSAGFSGWLTITSPDIQCEQSVSFGNVAINANGSQSITIYNYGQEPLTINSVLLANSVFNHQNTFPIIIAPSSNTNLNLVFNPNITGNVNGVLKIFSNDPDESPVNVQLSAFAYSPNYFSISDLTTSSNTTESLLITAENYSSFVGFQMDIVLPEGINYVTGSAALNASRKQDHVLFVSELSERIIRLLAFSPAQQPFIGNSGEVVSLGILTDNNLSPGLYTVAMENAIMGDQSSQNILWATNSGNVEISALSQISLKVFVEGAYQSSQMSSNLLNSGLLPLTQPFNTGPWNYAGTESLSSFPSNTVDWVLVELRDASSAESATQATIMAGWPKAMLLKADGSIVEASGSAPGLLSSSVQNQVYLVIHHRNHLDVMSSAPLVLSGNTYSYDFTDAVSKAYGGAAGYKQIGSGVYGMVAGDIDADGAVGVTDFNLWALRFGLTNVFNAADADLDGQVGASDFNKWALNFGVQTLLNGIWQNTPYRSQVPVIK